MDLPFKLDLSNKVIVITGGYGILGQTWVDALSECGAKIAIIGRDLVKAKEKAEEVKSKGKIALGVQCDVLNKTSIKKAHSTILKELGPCDILINGAGGNQVKGTTTKEFLDVDDLNNPNLVTFFDIDEEALSLILNTNFLGTFLVTQEFAQDMVNRKGCSIINISSMNAYTPLTKIPAYSAAKAAVTNFTQWLAVHLSKVGIRVNAIAPGFFETKQNKHLLRTEDGNYSERAKKILNNTPMGRFGNPNELIGVLLFLISEEASSFVNGTVIPIDGGFHAYSGV